MVDAQFETDRLILRRLQDNDARSISMLAGDYDVAKMTLNIPHPYPGGAATEFINRSKHAWDNHERYAFAIVLKATGTFMGVIGLIPEIRHRRAEVGYWIGKPHWGKGFMTETLKRIIQFGFEDLDLNRIQAGYIFDNPASGRVMEKVGMQLEGTFRQYAIRDDQPFDISYRAILREEYDVQQRDSRAR